MNGSILWLATKVSAQAAESTDHCTRKHWSQKKSPRSKKLPLIMKRSERGSLLSDGWSHFRSVPGKEALDADASEPPSLLTPSYSVDGPPRTSASQSGSTPVHTMLPIGSWGSMRSRWRLRSRTMSTRTRPPSMLRPLLSSSLR